MTRSIVKRRLYVPDGHYRYPTSKSNPLESNAHSDLQFSMGGMLCAVSNIAILLGYLNIAPSLFSDIDACDISKLYAVFLSLCFWRYRIVRSEVSPTIALGFRLLILVVAFVMTWFYVERLFGSSRTIGSFFTMIVLVFPLPAYSTLILDGGGKWNAPIWFFAKITIELAIAIPFWISGFALFDA